MAMIRKPESTRLLEKYQPVVDYSIPKNYINSRPFQLQIANQSVSMTAALDSPGCEPVQQTKEIRLSGGIETEVNFLITPTGIGDLTVDLTLSPLGVTLASQLLRTRVKGPEEDSVDHHVDFRGITIDRASRLALVTQLREWLGLGGK